jgi:hypothetical protein
MRELESTGLVSQRRRGQGKTNIYCLHDLRKVKFTHLEQSGSQKNKFYASGREVTTQPQVENLPPNNKQIIETEEHIDDDVIAQNLQNFGIAKSAASRLIHDYPEE